MTYPTTSPLLLRPQRWLTVVVLCVLSVLLAAQPAVPPKSDQLVNDYAGLMTQAQQNQLTQTLNAYARETSTQIAVVTETSLQGEAAFDRSLAIAVEWGIGGSEQKDNGVLVYVAKDDRKIFIQTGYGAEGFLNDARAGRIIRNIMTPAFRQGNYYAGIAGAVQAIMDAGRGEYTADDTEPAATPGIPPIFVFLFIFLIFMLLNRFGNRHDDDDDDDGGYWRDGRYDERNPRRRRRGGGWFILPGGFGGGGGGFSGGGGLGGGGGFGGFGGGGFGGGGAGGGW